MILTRRRWDFCRSSAKFWLQRVGGSECLGGREDRRLSSGSFRGSADVCKFVKDGKLRQGTHMLTRLTGHAAKTAALRVAGLSLGPP